jgi:1,2-diacylglycerol-3-alpha-glucose alpha-1,2-galactosyltransferase
MKVNVCSETEILGIKGEGVSTSFLDCVELLREGNDVEVFINNEGIGDVMHCHTYGPYYFWRGLRYKGKIVFTAHVIPETTRGAFPGWRLLMPLFKWYFKKVYSYADICIAISPMVEKAITDLGVKTKIVRLNNPVLLDVWKRTPELRKKGREILGLNENDFCVLGVGQVQTRKGCEDFITIGEHIPNAQFRWVGGRPFGFLTDGTRAISKQIDNASPNIKFAGMFQLSEMASIYAAADVFLFPSFTENCPLAPIEAAASGMPVIYRDIPEYKLLYKNTYLKAADNEAFIDLINRLMNDKEEYKKGLEISANLITQFDKNEIRKQLIELYRSLIDK